ncbi:MAG: hypothetical protein ACOCV7_04285 [Desulfonatronovibrionaceae bacterium]
MKYIIFEDFSGEPTPVIFPERVAFEEMREQIPYPRVVSAGILRLQDNVLHCSGEARELGKASTDQDSAVIAGYLRGSK